MTIDLVVSEESETEDLAQGWRYQSALSRISTSSNIRDPQANLVVFHNVVAMTRVLQALVDEGYPVTPEILARLAPYKIGHVNRFGTHDLRFDRVPPPVVEALRLIPRPAMHDRVRVERKFYAVLCRPPYTTRWRRAGIWGNRRRKPSRRWRVSPIPSAKPRGRNALRRGAGLAAALHSYTGCGTGSRRPTSALTPLSTLITLALAIWSTVVWLLCAEGTTTEATRPGYADYHT